MGKPENQWLKGKTVDRKKYPKMGNHKEWTTLGYMGKHKRIWKLHGKAFRCDSAGCDGSCKHYEWANISGNYKEDIGDWKMLCCRCHKFFDLRRAANGKEKNN